MLRRLVLPTILLVLIASSAFAQMREFEVTVTNLTQNQIMGPPIVVSHTGQVEIFYPGTPASDALAELAEDGSPAALAAALGGVGEVADVATGDGRIMPGASATYTVQVGGNYTRISMASMLVTTNDTFAAVRSIVRPTGRASATRYALAWDSGSEVNTESCDHIPGPPCGSGGVRVTDGAEGFIYISPGIHGIGSIDAAAYDWRNPVAGVTVRRAP